MDDFNSFWKHYRDEHREWNKKKERKEKAKKY